MGHSSLLNGSFQQAIDSFDSVLKIDPENVSAWDGKGAALSGLGRYKMAKLYFDFALQKDPKNPGLWLEEAKAAEQDGNWRQAGTGYDRALALNGSLAEAWLGIGNVSIATGHYDQAQQSFTNASRLGRKDAAREGESRAMQSRCQALLEQGKFEEALQCYDRILANNSSDPVAKDGKSRALVGLGQLQLARGNNSQARGIFEEASLLDPQSREAMQGLVQALGNVGDELMAKGLFSEALKSYETALALSPQDTASLAGKEQASSAIAMKSEVSESRSGPGNQIQNATLQKETPGSNYSRYLSQAHNYARNGSYSLALESINKSLEVDGKRGRCMALQRTGPHLARPSDRSYIFFE